MDTLELRRTDMDDNGHPRSGVVVALRKASEAPTQDDWSQFIQSMREAKADGRLARPALADEIEALDDTECADWLGHLRAREGTAIFDLFPLEPQDEIEPELETPPWWLIFPAFAMAMIVIFAVSAAVTYWTGINLMGVE
jgi:hypothetical protein